jgi:hypothetical protein
MVNLSLVDLKSLNPENLSNHRLRSSFCSLSGQGGTSRQTMPMQQKEEGATKPRQCQVSCVEQLIQCLKATKVVQ